MYRNCVLEWDSKTKHTKIYNYNVLEPLYFVLFFILLLLKDKEALHLQNIVD